MRNRLYWMLLALVSLTACSGAPIEHVTGRRFIAVGNNGRVIESIDGINWTIVYTTSNSSFRSIAYGADIFVLVGNGGIIYTSVDGVKFKPRSNKVPANLAHVIYTGERFVAVGGDEKIGGVAITSTNGIDWESLPSPSTFLFHAVAYKNGTLIAAAYSNPDMQTSALLTSVPGQTWEERVGPDFWDGLTTEDGVFTVGGSSFNHFTEGLGWTSETIAPGHSARGITHAENGFFVVGDMGAVHSSPDGVVFTDHSVSNETRHFKAITHNGADTFVAVGSDGLVAISQGGVSWTTVDTPTVLTLNGVAYGGVP